jgi:hypothetical protein
MRKTLLILVFLVVTSIFGCAPDQSSQLILPDLKVTVTPPALPTPPVPAPPSPSVIPFVGATVFPSITPSPISPTINPTYFNFPTPTFTPTLDPSLILLRIVSPGPMSKVVSPIEFIAHIAPYYAGATRVELIGENGVKLYGKYFKTYSNIGYYTRVDEKIDFLIQGVAEVARLQISTLDNQGRIQAFNSVRLLLQAVGGNEFLPPFEIQDRILLGKPLRNDQINGGELQVSGEYNPANDLPVVLELIDDQGNVLGSRLLQFDKATGKYQRFSTSIPYSVNKLLPVLMVIRQADDRIDGLAYLFSLPLIIGP